MEAMYDIALAAQDSRIPDLVNLVKKYRDGICRFSLVSTLEAGALIKRLTAIDVTLLARGFEGGYSQLARLVKTGNVRMVIFLHDPQLELSDLGIMDLLKSCNMRDIPFANNMTTAEFILHRFLEKEMATCWRCPDIRMEHNLICV
jgi:methylglyoxal synthase